MSGRSASLLIIFSPAAMDFLSGSRSNVVRGSSSQNALLPSRRYTRERANYIRKGSPRISFAALVIDVERSRVDDEWALIERRRKQAGDDYSGLARESAATAPEARAHPGRKRHRRGSLPESGGRRPSRGDWARVGRSCSLMLG